MTIFNDIFHKIWIKIILFILIIYYNNYTEKYIFAVDTLFKNHDVYSIKTFQFHLFNLIYLGICNKSLSKFYI